MNTLDDAIKLCDSKYGTLVNEYANKGSKDGPSKSYEKSVKFPEKEQKQWFRLWDSVIIAKAAEKLKAKRSDIEFDKNSGLVTVWRDANSSEKKNGAIGAKDFYQTEIYGTLKTSVYYTLKPQKITEHYFPDENKIKFVPKGSKA